MTITVTAKGDLGVHPIHGPILAGQTYTIDEEQFAEELFNPPDVGANNYSPLQESPEITAAPKGRK